MGRNAKFRSLNVSLLDLVRKLSKLIFLNVLCRLLIFVLDVRNYTRPMGQNEHGFDFFMNVLCGLYGFQKYPRPMGRNEHKLDFFMSVLCGFVVFKLSVSLHWSPLFGFLRLLKAEN